MRAANNFQIGFQALSGTEGDWRMSEPRRRRRIQGSGQERTQAPQRPEAERESAPQAGVELQDAHHTGAAQRRKRQEALRRQIRRERLLFAATALCLITAVASLLMIAGIVTRSIRTRMTNRALAQKRAELAVTPEPAAELTALAPEETALQETAATPVPEETTPMDETALPEETPAPEEKPGTPKATAKADVVRSTQYHVMGGEPLHHMEVLYEENRDLIGWLRMDEILDLPVVYRDNSYYLKRDFNKKKNDAGTIFLDENHRFGERTQNLLLHGHNMKDGTMFGRLTQFLNLSYMKNNPFVHFDTLWREEQYVIFAVLRVSLDVKSERFFNYFSYPTFSSDAEFNAYIRRLQLRSEYAIPIDVAPSDALLTLSTCLNDDRLVIVCRRVRENETRSELREAIRLAYKQ